MLENALFESDRHAETRKPGTVLLSTAIHAVIIVVLVLVPLFQPQAIPSLAAAIGIPLAEMPKPKLPDIPVQPQPLVQTVVRVDPGVLIAPPVIPRDIALIDEAPTSATIQNYAPANTREISLIRSIGAEPEATPLPVPPPPPPPAPVVTAPTRVHGSVQQANLIQQVRPDYPAIAKMARVQGVVLLEATIGRDGSVDNIRVISGHSLLTEAALNAVKQWRYKPTLLNGEPVEVITTITVNFTLQ